MESDVPEREVAPLSLAWRLSEVSRAVGSGMAPDEVLDLILQAALHITGATSGSLMLIDEPSQELRVEAAVGFQTDVILSTRLQVGQGVTGWAARHGKALRVADVSADERYHEVSPDIRSELAVPLIDEGRTLGVISVDSTRAHAFTAEHEAVMVSLAAQSARVIQNQRQDRQIRKKARALELLGGITAALASSLELDRVLEQVVEQTVKLTGAKLVSLQLLDARRETLAIRAVHGAAEDYRSKPPLPVAGSLTGAVIRSGRPRSILDVRQEEGFKHMDLAESEGLVSLLCVPLLWKEKPIGALNVYTGGRHAFSDEDISLVASLAAHSAIAIENARLHSSTIEAEEALRSADRLAVLGELAAGVAHEIRNPLASINVILHGFGKDAELKARMGEDLAMLRRQVQRLDQIVDRFLGYAKKRPAPEKKPVRLADVAAETAMLLQHPVSQRKVQLWVDIPDDLPEWIGDPVELGQVLYNLTLNAVQAAHEGGEVVIRAAHETESIELRSPALRLDVSDNGSGLPDEVRKRLFQPFVTTKPDGVGLGLSIVHRLVTRWGGTIHALEREGGGTTFQVHLPLSRG